MYVPTLLAVSPLAATRSAPTRMTSTSPRAIRCPAATSGSSVCGHAGLGQLPGGQPGALQVRPRLVDPDVERAPGVVGRLDDPEGGPVLAAGQRPGVAVGQDADRPVARAAAGPSSPNAGQPAVVGRRLEDDRVGLGAHRVGDGPAVVGQLADLLVAGHHPLDRPAQVDRRRPGVDEGVAPAPRRVARRAYGMPLRCCSALIASPMAATWPIAGAPRTIISRIA